MAADLHQLSVDLDRSVSHAETCIKRTESVNDILESLINSLDAVEVDTVRAPGDFKDPVLMARRRRMQELRSKSNSARDLSKMASTQDSSHSHEYGNESPRSPHLEGKR